jgi:deoxyribonuclease IV
MWRASVPGVEQVRLLCRARERLDLYPLAVHCNYLVNLASPDAVIRARSIAAFRSELERAALLGAEFLVAHPGSYKGQTPEEGITAFADGLRHAADGIDRKSPTVLLENTAGCGAQIGGRFEELRAIRERALELTDLRVGYCLDTCHLLAAGYDVSSEDGLRATMRQAERVLGMTHVRLIHANDSKAPLGSHLDRHENIGNGYIGSAGFRRILAHPKLRSKPFILETPVEQDGDDRRNLENLKKLCPKSRTTITKSS